MTSSVTRGAGYSADLFLFFTKKEERERERGGVIQTNRQSQRQRETGTTRRELGGGSPL